MNSNDLCQILEGELIHQSPGKRQISGAYTSDLLSDVMANAKEGQALVTIQAHKNSVAVASLYGAPCIVICNHRPLPPDMVEAVESEGMDLIRTTLDQYEVSGRIWQHFNSPRQV